MLDNFNHNKNDNINGVHSLGKKRNRKIRINDTKNIE